MTIKNAKELCRQKIGRLPRCGYEVEVLKQEETRTIRNLDDRMVTRTIPVIYYLVNEAGRYRVREYCDWSQVPMRGMWSR